MRWGGLAKAAVKVRLTAIACNLKRTMNILSVPA
jgi:IS5 family transposase